MKKQISSRQDSEPPLAIKEWGWKYHHTGMPTSVKRAGERYLPDFKCFVSGFGGNPFGIEWMRFEEDSPVHPLVQTVPHLAFEVDDLDQEISKHKLPVLTAPNSPSPGIRVAMIEYDGAPIELITFEFSNRNT